MGKKKGKGKNKGGPQPPISESEVQADEKAKTDLPESTKHEPEASTSETTETKIVSESKTSDSKIPDSKMPESKALQPKVRQINPEDLGMQFKRKFAFSKFPDRPGYGSVGKKIKLISNCFKLNVPEGNVFHYDVSIENKQRPGSKESSALVSSVDNDKKYRCLSTKRNREVIKLMLDTNPIFKKVYAAYDGQKNMYTRSPLEGNFPVKCEVVMPEEDGDRADNARHSVYTVQIKPALKEDGDCAISLDSMHAFYAEKVSSVPQETIMALETILRQGPCLQFTPIGRSFFYPPKASDLHPLGGGLEIWYGYHQSIRLGQWGPMVNLNRTASSFYQKGPVLSFIAEILGTSVSDLRKKNFLQNIEIKKLNSKLKNLKIEVTHLKKYRRKYRIVRLTKESANRLEFEITENGRTTKKTVAAYFRERYGKNLEFPNLPCLHVFPENKNTYIPIEVCEILGGQHYKKKLDPPQTAKMIRFTAPSPSERFSEIMNIAENPQFNNDANVQRFGVEVSKTPIKCEGRILDSPCINYKEGPVKPVDGSWSMRQKKFFSGAVIKSWVLLNFSRDNVTTENLKSFVSLLLKVSKDVGLTIPNPRFVAPVDAFRTDIKSVFREMKTKHNAELAIIVLPGSDKTIYQRIKQTAETNVGLKTQCIRDINIYDSKKMNPQLISNLCLKINAKAGGENNVLLYKELPPVLYKPVIIIGADVNHPGITEGFKPSLAACVCSLDNKLSKYAVTVRAQMNLDDKKQAVEIILDLQNMVKDLLLTFYKHTNGKKPEKIIFYRDGVSEGQFSIVHDHEIKCIREACRSLQAGYEPGITFIVVQKRHHIRFIPASSGDGAGMQKNLPPGTTIDTGVSDPIKFDFFLCSHLGLKGTSRPSHYTVLADDNKFTADDLQKMTYQLCHTYARCTKSISIPVPVAYADLAAYRARQHLEAGLEESTSGSDSSGGSETFQLSQSVIDSIKVTGEMKGAMYFV